ncbi:MAG: serine protease Do [Azoarcus sp.]|uniref:Trypsin-like peptidase domain-containing protein n=1 Tax=Aromatoleum tolulyticum TaxID=34027 RepID=A0A1N6WNJ6_9RHOO|nr:serine protease Do [Azoarcus sp.]SIQ91596.1 Trypsin-like peptidase domain-containing protein [Aromatoleum tolulyticum]
MESLVVVVPGAPQSAIRRVAKAAVDPNTDLALLRLDGEPLPALPLAEANFAAEGQPIAFMGFPIGSALGLTPVTHRGIVAAVTPIGIPQANSRQLNPALIRRLSGEKLRVYQLDATAYPGNSGSPLFDPDSGEVLGIINMVFVKGTKENALSAPSGITYAIPVSHLRALLMDVR